MSDNRQNLLASLLEEKDVPPHHIHTILRRYQRSKKIRLDAILGEFPMISPEVIAEVIAGVTGVPTTKLNEVDMKKIPVNDPRVPVPDSISVVPIAITDKFIRIAVDHPQSAETRKFVTTLSMRNPNHKTEITVADSVVRRQIYRLFQNDQKTYEPLVSAIRKAESVVGKGLKVAESDLLAIITNIFSAAVDSEASDIQLLATHHFGQVQFKIEGTGHIVAEMERELYDRVMRKFAADININNDTLKQKTTEADIQKYNGMDENIFRQFNFRVQMTIPEPSVSDTIAATIRLLSRNINLLSFPEAGFTPEQVRQIHRATDAVAGLILLVGPVNSGKSTTLFSMLSQIDPVRRLIKTIENPIEFRCPLWEQNNLGGSSAILNAQDEQQAYQNQIRGMVRKSPDCLLAGEMRSASEAGEIFGLSYASTLCFSSLHAENVSNAVGRMRYWGLANYDIASVTRLIIAQRLVRSLCEHCKVTEDNPANISEYKLYKSESGKTDKVMIYAASKKGCEHCRYTGFFGRQLIAEMLSVDDPKFEKVISGKNHHDIQDHLDASAATLWHSGMRHVHSGKASVDEVVRHTMRRKQAEKKR